MPGLAPGAGGRIEWSLRSLQSKHGFNAGLEWRDRSKLLNFSFDRAQYSSEIQQETAYAEFNHPNDIEFGPEWQEPQTFATLAQSLADGLAGARAA